MFVLCNVIVFVNHHDDDGVYDVTCSLHHFLILMPLLFLLAPRFYCSNLSNFFTHFHVFILHTSTPTHGYHFSTYETSSFTILCCLLLLFTFHLNQVFPFFSSSSDRHIYTHTRQYSQYSNTYSNRNNTQLLILYFKTRQSLFKSFKLSCSFFNFSSTHPLINTSTRV
jgi:hypothetical protein